MQLTFGRRRRSTLPAHHRSRPFLQRRRTPWPLVALVALLAGAGAFLGLRHGHQSVNVEPGVGHVVSYAVVDDEEGGRGYHAQVAVDGASYPVSLDYEPTVGDDVPMYFLNGETWSSYNPHGAEGFALELLVGALAALAAGFAGAVVADKLGY